MDTMKNYGKVKPGGDFAGCRFVAPKQREHRRCSTFHLIVSSALLVALLFFYTKLRVCTENFGLAELFVVLCRTCNDREP